MFFLRYLHWEHYGKLHQCVSVILQHLWSVYGSTFVDKCLLYSALAFSFRCYPRSQLKFRSGLYLTFISRFQASLLTAIRRNEISECHLFAIFLVVEAADNSDDLNFVKEHQQGFLSVLKRVMEIAQNQDPDIRRSCRLYYLYNYALSLLRRMELLWVHPSPIERLSLLWKMHMAAEKLPLPEHVPDIRAAMGFPARYWRRVGEEPGWQSLMWNLIDERGTLYICFQRLFVPHFCENRTDESQLVARSVASVKERLAELLDLPSVKDLFRCVSCTLKWKSDCQISNPNATHEMCICPTLQFGCRHSFRKIFFQSFHHTWALVTIMNYLITGAADSGVKCRVRQILRAVPLFRTNSFPYSSGGRRTSLYIAMALLLTTPLLGQKEGKRSGILIANWVQGCRT